MAHLIGAILAVAVGVFARVIGFDRDRSFYPTVMIVIACLYALYAVIGGSTQALVLELIVGAVFVISAVAGFKSSLWIVAVALAAHGIFDLTHGHIFANPGVPPWWPGFCLTYDVTAGAYLAWLIQSGRVRASVARK